LIHLIQFILYNIHNIIYTGTMGKKRMDNRGWYKGISLPFCAPPPAPHPLAPAPHPASSHASLFPRPHVPVLGPRPHVPVLTSPSHPRPVLASPSSVLTSPSSRPHVLTSSRHIAVLHVPSHPHVAVAVLALPSSSSHSGPSRAGWGCGMGVVMAWTSRVA